MKYKNGEKTVCSLFLSLPDLKDKQKIPPTQAVVGGAQPLPSVSAPDARSPTGQLSILHFLHLFLSVYQWLGRLKDAVERTMGDRV